MFDPLCSGSTYTGRYRLALRWIRERIRAPFLLRPWTDLYTGVPPHFLRAGPAAADRRISAHGHLSRSTSATASRPKREPLVARAGCFASAGKVASWSERRRPTREVAMCRSPTRCSARATLTWSTCPGSSTTSRGSEGREEDRQSPEAVSYTHLTLPTTPYV